MAYNVMKLLSRPYLQLPKPQLFAQVVVHRGQTSDKPEAVLREYAAHNFAVYRLAAGDAPRLLTDILETHHRLRGPLDLAKFAAVLSRGPWSSTAIDAALHHVEQLGFSAAYTRDYAVLAREKTAFVPWLVRHLLPELEGQEPRGASYRTYLGQAYSTPLHLSVLAQFAPERGEQSFQALRRWQHADGKLTALGPHFGLSRDYDDFILANAPYLWALVATCFNAVEGARAWVVEQMRGVLDAVSRTELTPFAFTALWMLHLCADEDLGLHDNYELARTAVNEHGGINGELLASPPACGGSVIHEPDTWREELYSNMRKVPDATDLRRLVSTADMEPVPPALIALDELLYEPDPDIGGALAAWLHAPHESRRVF